jgi:hypothetical protein
MQDKGICVKMTLQFCSRRGNSDLLQSLEIYLPDTLEIYPSYLAMPTPLNLL